MNNRDAAERVLRQAGEPVHYKVITQRALDAGLDAHAEVRDEPVKLWQFDPADFDRPDILG